MANMTILGAGLAGLSTAMMLRNDGHDVTVLERDPAPPGAEPWETWQRPGVNQFRLPHFMLPRWWQVLSTELPTAASEVLAAGGSRFSLVPPPHREGDALFDTVTARRPVIEAALARAAEASGVVLRRGVRLTGVHLESGRVTGVTTAEGPVRADLVIDCLGRRSAMPDWLAAAGAPRPAEEKDDAGFVYYSRHFRGDRPDLQVMVQQQYASVSVLTLPGDDGTWSVVVVASTRDHALRVLRDPSVWTDVLRRYPLVAPWIDATPITGVDALAGIEDRLRHYAPDGTPLVTGMVPVGDAWACTNPSLGRGAAFTLIHARLLRDTLRDTDPADHEKVARRFHEATARTVLPLYRATNGFDKHRLAEIDSDVTAVPYRTDDLRWIGAKALYAAALRDPDMLRAYLTVAGFLETPDEVFAKPGVRDRVLALGVSAPQYPLPGPGRAELLRLCS
ncbi:NAD(P)/FAD-dependent oxidoreductase [Paractinoplanes atraurantiacus]|uniref:Dehydrogenase (Flavoprotein) n=1 Tax=Paractinoplanes atraurantiacus TaxID=1036182 RepID=A0A285JWP2_9ACTN|nr:FAD-dependent oxidoreductase [Actinoplanes atraurantiacus]SNY64735.1 Dehydrogenase (flavoprotein) [Actinoplanes atraurantiacus]